MGYDPKGISEKEMQKLFRAGELQRRAARNKIILNYAELANEPLTKEEKMVTKEALAAIKKQNEDFQKITKIDQGYWRNLRDALLGRK